MLPAVFTSARCFDHQTGPHHVETPERLRVLQARIAAADPAALREAPPAEPDALERVHPHRYLEFLRGFAERGGGLLGEPDMVVSPASYDAAVAAAGAAVAAVRHACDGKGNAFAAIRPPGHHASPSRPWDSACSAMPSSPRGRRRRWGGSRC